jgi:SAM-dependent methyltransferase
MTAEDLAYLSRLVAAGLITGPVLELGAGYGAGTGRPVVEAAGLAYCGTDLKPGPGVDVAADFERAEDMAAFGKAGPFGTALVLNVLEHTFDPVRVLDNVVSLVRPGGTVVTVTPAVWQLHDWPMDCWRLLPNFAEEYARRRGLTLVADHFEFLGVNGGPVRSFAAADGSYRLPPARRPGLRGFVSRAVHRLFDTHGRGAVFPSFVATAATFRKSG